ncbi:MAG: radical SAM protein [Chloroflexi bacterium]|nr:radical SAM protein [Chloroflexota bacterium]
MRNPIYVDWAITSKCNLDCRHCVGMEGGELTHAQVMKITRDIISLSPRWVILEGGEPLMRPDLPEVGRMLKKAGIEVFLITNGNAFTEEKIKELAAFSPKILFSIDGADAATYENTKTGASFETAKEWAKRCTAAGLFHGITTVLSRANLRQVKQLVRLTEDLGGKNLIFLPLKPFGDTEISRDYYEQNKLSPLEQEAAVEEIYSCGSRLDIFYDEPFLWNLAAEHGLSLDGSDSGVTIPEVTGCAAAHSLYIQTGGSVRPCMFCSEELTFGNAAKEPLGEIWRRMSESESITGWSDQNKRKGNCGECSQFESCRGCLARVAKLTGDVLQADPCCPFAG